MRSKYGKRGVPRALRKPGHDDRPRESGPRESYDGARARAAERPDDRAPASRPSQADHEGERESTMPRSASPADAGAPGANEGRSTASLMAGPDGHTVQVVWKPRRNVQVPRGEPESG